MSYEFKPEDIAVTAWPPGNESALIHRPIHGIRVVHLPTGTVVTCETERSQHRNREIALQMLADQVEGKPTYAELVAQVESVRQACLDWENTETPNAWQLIFDEIKRCANAKPRQCLRDIQAEAGKTGYMQGIYDWREAEEKYQNFDITFSANEYAASIAKGE